MWFQNRRAKWRKQARLSLLQDAWRLRCLGLTNSSSAAAAAAAAAASMIPNEHQRQSPKPDHSSSPPPPPIPLIGSNSTNSPIPKMGNMKMSNETSMTEDGESNSNKTENFTLMHPAFQNVLQSKQRKYYANAIPGMDANTDVFDKNCTNRDVRNCIANALHSDFSRKIGAGTERHHRSDTAITGRLRNTASHHCESSDVSPDSSDSEEIDLTSNGIDFSNNNNNNSNNTNSNNGKSNRKSEKNAMY